MKIQKNKALHQYTITQYVNTIKILINPSINLLN